MSKIFSTIIFSFLLLFQTSLIAEDDTTSPEILTEEVLEQSEVPEEAEATEANASEPEVIEEVQEPEATKEVLSQAQKEALAAEAAELRELGVEEEPLPE